MYRRGIGEKNAVALVRAFGGVEAVLAGAGAGEVKVNKNIQAALLSEDGQEAARISRQLVRIDTDVAHPDLEPPLDRYR